MKNITVIIISYNNGRYLNQSIESVLNQNIEKENLQILIGDDGSNDNSLEIIESYKKQYPDIIDYYVMDRNDGVKIPSIRVSNSIKKGISLSKNDYLVVLSSDDYFSVTNKLNDDIDFLEKHKKYSAIVSDFTFSYPNKELVIRNNYSEKIFWSGRYAHISCFTFRKNTVKDNILNYLCDDTGLIYSIICSGKIYFKKKAEFAYRQNSEGIMAKSTNFKLYILELMLFYDILTSSVKKKYKLPSFSRFSRPMKKYLKDQTQIYDEANKIYREFFERENKNNFIKQLIFYDKQSKKIKLKIKFIYLFSKLMRYYFGIMIRLQIFFRRVKKDDSKKL